MQSFPFSEVRKRHYRRNACLKRSRDSHAVCFCGDFASCSSAGRSGNDSAQTPGIGIISLHGQKTGEIVSHAEMKVRGGLDREKVFVEWQPPLQDYFERDLESDTVTCPMGQTLLYDGSEKRGHKKDPSDRRYRRLSACCKNATTDVPLLRQGRSPLRRARSENRKLLSKSGLWADYTQNESFFPTNQNTSSRGPMGGGRNSSVLSEPTASTKTQHDRGASVQNSKKVARGQLSADQGKGQGSG